MRIAFFGPAGSGKDTAASIMSELAAQETPIRTEIYSFAAPIKTMVHELLIRHTPHTPDDFTKEELTDLPGFPSLRDLYQAVGDAGRQICDTFWVDFLVEQLEEDRDFFTGEPVLQIVTDCRYPTEARKLMDAGFSLVEVHRPDHPKHHSDHSSERSFSKIKQFYPYKRIINLKYRKDLLRRELQYLFQEELERRHK